MDIVQTPGQGKVFFCLSAAALAEAKAISTPAEAYPLRRWGETARKAGRF
jgi:hypothetical protein